MFLFGFPPFVVMFYGVSGSCFVWFCGVCFCCFIVSTFVCWVDFSVFVTFVW